MINCVDVVGRVYSEPSTVSSLEAPFSNRCWKIFKGESFPTLAVANNVDLLGWFNSHVGVVSSHDANALCSNRDLLKLFPALAVINGIDSSIGFNSNVGVVVRFKANLSVKSLNGELFPFLAVVNCVDFVGRLNTKVSVVGSFYAVFS